MSGWSVSPYRASRFPSTSMTRLASSRTLERQHASSSGGEFHPSALTGRVGDWRAGLGRSLCSLLARSFVCECHTISAVPRFQPPPRRTQHADFPHCALLFASPQGLWDLSCRSGFRRWSNHSVAIEQLQSLVQLSPTPPRPAEALSVPGSQNFQDVSAFALTYILRLRSWQIDGRLYHLVLAFLVVGDFTNSRAPSLHGRYPASTLLRTHPSPSRLRSTSRLSRLYDRPCSGDFAPGRGGLLQLLGMSLSPCCRFHPAEVLEPHRSDFGSPCCLRPPVGGSAFGATHFRGHFCVHCRYGPVTRRLPEGDVVDRLQSLGFPPPFYPNYGASDSYPGRPFSC